MIQYPVFLGEIKANYNASEITGKLIDFENEKYYKISNCDSMRPFFMSIVSDSDHWMFISSNGGLSAGRRDSKQALFPYYTDDKITESADITGSKTILRVHSHGKVKLWEPFSDRYLGVYNTIRNLYKNNFGNKVIFEEVNVDLDLTFRYQWSSSDKYGFIKNSILINSADKDVKVTVLDGLQNIMPYGVDTALQSTSSNLVDAYKKNELETAVGLGIYALSAIIVDRAEPSEALKATTIWSLGMENPRYLLSSLQLDNFRRGHDVKQEEDVRAEKGAYFIIDDINLQANSKKDWMIVADVNQSIGAITELSEEIKNNENLKPALIENVQKGTRHLIELSSAADGMQLTADKLRNTRHFANTLFNIMRGGVFDKNYQIEKADFVKYVKKANIKVFEKNRGSLQRLPKLFSLKYLKAAIVSLQNRDKDENLKRLCFEYLPLKFSRRHGDPSRPWNKFAINTKNEDGSKILDYQGNWRDIFQNWEALAQSYPEFMESMIHKFLNATTFDGYNPYRVTKDGFEWETIEPDDPWSYIGYWGDHQVIYLLKFIEFIEKYHPDKLAAYFNQDIFVYANVPYRIKSYSEILKNPKDTIVLDRYSEEKIHIQKKVLGADGTLLTDANSRIYQVNLIEKLLAIVLAKLSNFIPEGGIWMNTQRPEWNDANNALVGNGVSMVTLYYLRRFLNFFEDIVQNSDLENYSISKELLLYFGGVHKILNDHTEILSGRISNKDRKTVLDGLGNAGSDYRNTIYENGFSSTKESIFKTTLLKFLSLSKAYLEHSIDANRRNDRLYHSYNLMTVENDLEISVSYLPEMLEGQVAILSSGYLSLELSLEVLNALKKSSLFRADQNSYLLYPNKQLPKFTQKNTIPQNKAEASQLIKRLVEDGDLSIIEKDVLGKYHFNGSFNNADSLKNALFKLPEGKYGSLVKMDTSLLLETFEEIFDHKSFTGRSGTFYGYEGLGSIYWHMVSKLLLAVQETCLEAIATGENEVVIDSLKGHYYEISEGIGVHKSPELYGAFPTDPYSHTPGGKGAQQPGMTGQVKEDILCRFGELGLSVSRGCLVFNPVLLRHEEFLKTDMIFDYITVNGDSEKIELGKDMLAFTYCQIPIIYKLASTSGLKIILKNGDNIEKTTLDMGFHLSKEIFGRTGEIVQIIVSLDKLKSNHNQQ